MTESLFPLADLMPLIAKVPEPFLVPDVTPKGWPASVVFHVLRDLVDIDELTLGPDGYRRAE